MSLMGASPIETLLNPDIWNLIQKHLSQKSLHKMSCTSHSLNAQVWKNLQYLSFCREGFLQTNRDFYFMKAPRIQRLVLKHQITANLVRRLTGLKALDELVLDHFIPTQLPFILPLTQLKSLSIYSDYLTDCLIPQLCPFTSLEHLDISGTPIGENGLIFIVKTFLHLQSLCLDRCKYLKSSDFPLLGILTQLKSLSLVNAKLSEDSLGDLFFHLSNLEYLNLKGAPLTPNGLVHLQPLIHLTHLILPGPSLLPGLEHLTKITTLQTLDFNDGSLAAVGVDYIPQIKHFNNLRSLNLRGIANVEDNTLQYLTNCLSLHELVLHPEHQITDDGLSHLSPLKELYTLLLPLGNSSDGLSGHLSTTIMKLRLNLHTLEDIAHLTNLVCLSCTLNPSYPPSLVSLQGMVHLRSLGIAGALPPSAFTLLSLHTQLRSLELSYCDISSTSLALLRSLTNLTNLNLTGGEMEVEDMQYLATMTKLRSVALNWMGGIQKQDLKSIKHLTKLKHVTLDFKKFSRQELHL